MFGITDLTTYIIGTVLIILLPGPNSLYVMSIASRYGIKAGYQGAFGVFVGDVILMFCTVLGAASLLLAFPWVFTVVKVLGASYLTYLGFKLLKASISTWRKAVYNRQVEAELQTIYRIRPFRTALTVSLLNPKAILFFLSFFVQFIDPDYPHPALSFITLAIILQVTSMSYLTLLIFSGRKLSGFFRQSPKISSVSVFLVGLLFFSFGVKLATSSLT
ncbi:leucine efflux protein LeuE [Acinetobacter radioresistens]|uniref:leucine efflux protein LeuE n=1 Tax=Acinetobacter TaxID=469 RepID=UPI0002D5A02D|nr:MULTISPECIES: leucine efflux protein LeuE [Acinetobacter]AWV86495.1 leucine efflux protein LeuE [Acinetobacter radioresistens]MCK4089613.1 leucine efflux protein LeuE [Acinetobacter radioresistens]MCU4516619.1 leucine efflux protein LeuE [Acinetobacter radioresistens]MCX0328268.1 leucine efflux protein LeuE [Acinetobacter radioresistens]MCX0333431.1 leucine efflux protein LeuE [Acinetobacter radioresistens]